MTFGERAERQKFSQVAKDAGVGYRKRVNAIRQSRLIKLTAFCCLGLAWLVASNHCAWAAIIDSAAKHHEQRVCCSHNTESKKSPVQESTACCTALIAPVPATLHATEALLLAGPVDFGPMISLECPEFGAAPVVLEYSSGPPGLSLWTSLVFKRSMPAHAPPHVVA
ncbi:MAG: hypothetical protein BGO12_15895 [Verrucomicrobia bacterium 61-8]|nr:hypothetical protein [Verrucomicrobiota bacterium]OJV03101.1 MAG: hypothetical protein BGO12_15895 [Verrucomicrobia bacterium 61-8]